MLILLCALTAIVLVAWNALPNDATDSLGSGMGRASLGPVLEFLLGLFLFAVMLSLVIGFALFLVDQHVMPLGIASQAAETVITNPSGLNSGPHNPSQSHSHWFIAKGGTAEQAKSLQRFLMSVLPILILLTTIVLLVLTRFSGGIMDAAVQDLQRKTRDENLKSVRQQYHQSNQRRVERRRSRG